MSETFPPMAYLRELRRGKVLPQALFNSALPSYLHPNPIVRWWAWSRVRAAQALIMDCAGERAVDLGCGLGVMLQFLARRYSHVLGIETEPEASQKVVSSFSLSNVDIIRRATPQLPLDTGSVDLVVALDVLEHIPDLHAETLEINRVLKPGGNLLVSIPTENFLYRVGRRILTGFARYASYHLRTSDEVLAVLCRTLREVRRKEILPLLTCSIVAVYEKADCARGACAMPIARH